MNSIDEAFYFLWNNGHRLISKEEQNDTRHGMYRIKQGVVNGYTIDGMKHLAKNSNLEFGNLKLAPEEVEILFNYIKFIRSLKSN